MARVTGTLSVNPRGFGFASFDDAEPSSAFVAPPDLNGLLDGDEVSGELSASDRGYRLMSPRLEARSRRALFGRISVHRGKQHIAIDPEVSNTDWPLDGAADLAEGDWIVARIEGKRAVYERSVDAAQASLERVLVRHDLPTDFAADLKIPAKPSRSRARRDLRDVVTITIDAPKSRDLDDALSVLPADPQGGLRILVSIADVDSMVPEGSELDGEARVRGTSVYLAGQVIPMLPRKLSEDALSLLPGQERPVLTVELRIDPEGAVTAVDIFEATIRSNGRLSYRAVEAYLERGDGAAVEPALQPTLRWLRTAVARLDTVRAARGGVSLLREEANVRLDESGEPTALTTRRSTSAHALVERLMVAANEAVAGWLVDRGLPGVYRVHDPPEPARARMLDEAARNFGLEAGLGEALTPLSVAAFERQLEGRANAPALYTVLGMMLGPARYTATPGLHFGLGAPLYLHFTSPIRRYADLCVHRIVKGYLRGERERHAGEPGLEELAERLTDVARRAAKAERERLRMLAARLFAGRVGERLMGNVVAIKPFGLIVQLEGMGVTAVVATEHLASPTNIEPGGFAMSAGDDRYVLGQSLQVAIDETDEILGRIEARLA